MCGGDVGGGQTIEKSSQVIKTLSETAARKVPVLRVKNWLKWRGNRRVYVCVCGSVSQSRTSNNIIASGLSPIGNEYKEDAAARILQRGNGISCKTRPRHLSLSESWQNPAELPELPFLKSVPGWEKAVSLAPGIYCLGQRRQTRRYGTADWSGACGWWLVDKVGLSETRQTRPNVTYTLSQTRLTSLSTAITTSVTFLWSSFPASSPRFTV